jgi:hypothetical protein
MDISKLMVGQKVLMQSGNQFQEATVAEVTETYVQVEIARTEKENGYAIDFRYDGTQAGVWGWVDAWSPLPLGFGGPGEPWRLVSASSSTGEPRRGHSDAKTETDTAEMVARIREAFRVSKNGNNLGTHLCDVACDRDYWWVTCERCGREWEVVEASGGDSVDGFDFVLRRYRLEFCRE